MAAWDTAATPREAAGAAARLAEAQSSWDAALAAIDEARKTQAAAPGPRGGQEGARDARCAGALYPCRPAGQRRSPAPRSRRAPSAGQRTERCRGPRMG
jgi:hypothetical protein